jgi:ubiquinone/menaquinone biosynthesis C-methylase UbiE
MKLRLSLVCLALLTHHLGAEEKIPTEEFLFDLITQVKGKSVDTASNRQAYLTTTPRIPTLSGAAYNQYATFQYAVARAQAETLQLKGTERILDLGCGDGAVTAYLATQVPAGSIIGIDLAPTMIEFAKSTYAPKLSNLSFDVQDIDRLTYQNEFDVVTSFFALQQVPDLNKALANVYRALKPGGRAFLFLPMFNDSPFHDHWRKTISHPQWQQFFKHQPPASGFKSPQELSTTSLEELCGNSNFANWQIEASFIPYTFANKAAFKTWHKELDKIFNFVPWSNVPSEALEDAFIDDLLMHTSMDSSDTGETYTIRMGCALIQATK